VDKHGRDQSAIDLELKMANKAIINKNGFVLTDVVLGMFILTVALLAIGGLYFQSGKASILADNQTVAYNWAQERLEYLKSASAWRGNSSTSTPPTVPTDTGNSLPPRSGFTRTTTVVCPAKLAALPATTINAGTLLTAVNSRLIDVTVTVNWTENSRDKSVSLETLIERE